MPSLKASDPKKAFLTHANYLRAFIIAINEYAGVSSPRAPFRGVLSGLHARILSQPPYKALAKRPATDDAEIKRLLSLAWATERVMALPAPFAATPLISISNNWTAVQAYYASYQASQALYVARGNQPVTRHDQGQNVFVDQWVTHNRDFGAWSLGADPRNCCNLPSHASLITSTSNLSEPHSATCWTHVYRALRTTRDDLLADRLTDARARKVKDKRREFATEQEARRLAKKRLLKPKTFSAAKLTQSETATVDTKLGTVGFLHYLYRLRTRSNYEDSQMFVDGPNTLDASRTVNDDLRLVVAYTLLLHELHISVVIGAAKLAAMADAWLASAGAPSDPIGLATRRAYLVAPLSA